MDLKNLPDDQLHKATLQAADREREALSVVLHHLREVEKRRLFSALGHPSLHEYATRELTYSDAQAQRRISAMRLLKELPEIESKITSGSLNLTHLNLAQSLIVKRIKDSRAEPRLDQAPPAPMSKAQKLELLSELESQSTRAAQKIIHTLDPELKPRSKDLSFEAVEDSSLRNKLLQVKGLLAHSHPHLTLAELLHLLCDEKLAQKTRTRKSESAALSKAVSKPAQNSGHSDLESPSAPKVKSRGEQANQEKKFKLNSPGADHQTLGGQSALGQSSIVQSSVRQLTLPQSSPSESSLQQSSPPQTRTPTSTHSPRINKASLKREVWRRDKGQCVRCGSTHALQIDHIHPKALGGADVLANLRLLCRSCNQRAAIEIFGMGKMGTYLRSPTRAYAGH